MIRPITIATTALAATATAAAADLLPLKHGIYVPSNVACKGASNADMVNYWGGKSSIGAAQAQCTITKVSNKGTIYTVADACADLASGDKIAGDPRTITIASPVAFTMDGTGYKYCGPRPQF